MAHQSVSPAEAEIAGEMLEKLYGTPAAGIESTRVVSRAAVEASPDRTGPHGATIRMRTRGGLWVTLDVEDAHIYDDNGNSLF